MQHLTLLVYYYGYNTDEHKEGVIMLVEHVTNDRKYYPKNSFFNIDLTWALFVY